MIRALFDVFVVVAIVASIGTICNKKPDSTPVEKAAVAPTIPKVTYYPNDSASVELINNVFEAVKKRCKYIKNYTESAKEVSFSYNLDNYYYTKEKYGWKHQIEIGIWLEDDFDKYQADMVGQRLIYYVGLGKRPGIVAVKWQSAHLCGEYDYPKDGDLFMPYDSLPAF